MSQRGKKRRGFLVKEAMAATYVEVSLEDVEKLLKRSFHATRPKQGKRGGIYYYDLKVGDNVAIRVWSSVSARSDMGRGVGESAIRVHLVALRTGRPLEAGKAPIVKRTQNWRTNLQDLIEEKLELFEEKEEYWESRASGASPAQAEEAFERAVDEDGEGDDGPEHEEELQSAEPRMLDEIASWARCSNGDWGVAVKDPRAREGDKVQARTQAGDTSVITLAGFDREIYGKRIFFKGKQEGGRPQRSYDYRSRRY